MTHTIAQDDAHAPVTRSKSNPRVSAIADQVAACCDEASRDSCRSKMRSVLNGRSFTLDLKSKSVITLPASLAQAHTLQCLNLSSNRLRELPWAVSQLFSLQELFLDRNELRELPPDLAQLHGLRELHLSHNQLTEIPHVVASGALPALKWLFVGHNPITELPTALALLPSLSALNVTGCPLVDPPAEVTARGFEAIRRHLQHRIQRHGDEMAAAAAATAVSEEQGAEPRRLRRGSCDSGDSGDGSRSSSGGSSSGGSSSSSSPREVGSDRADEEATTAARARGKGRRGAADEGEGAPPQTPRRMAKAPMQNDTEPDGHPASPAGAPGKAPVGEGGARTGGHQGTESLRRSRLDDIYGEVQLCQPSAAAESDDDESLEARKDSCVVCFEPRTHILVPCGHYCLCAACSVSIMRRSNVANACPVCRAPFELAMKVFA